MTVLSPQRLILHSLYDFAEFPHRGNQLGLRCVFAPVARNNKRFVVVLYSLVSVIFGFEEIKSHRDIPAFDIAILVERQLLKHEHMEIKIGECQTAKEGNHNS